MLESIKKLNNKLREFDNLVIGYSGGADSQFLLHIASKLDKNIIAANMKYNFSPNADNWQNFCRENAKSLGVRFETKHFAAPKTGNAENIARNARFNFFSEIISCLNGKTALLTAHHKDDLVETMLLKLARGSGIEALASIKERSERQGMTIIRPLLDITKAEIVEKLNNNNIPFVHDESNDDCTMDRNYIRNIILPQLNGRWPGFTNNAYKSSQLLYEDTEYIDQKISDLYHKALTNNGELNVRLLPQNDYELRKILRRWILDGAGVVPAGKLLGAIISQSIINPAHNAGKFIKKDFVIYKKNHLLTIEKAS